MGDLVVSSMLIENSTVFDDCKKVVFLVKEQYLDLFKNYDGKVEFIGYNYSKYKISLVYKYKFLSQLRKEGFEKCIHLTAARGILNEEITHLIGATEVIALNSFWEYLGKSIGKYFDGKYSKIIADSTLSEYEKHYELLKYFGVEGTKIFFNNGVTFNESSFKEINKFNIYSDAIIIAPFSSLMNREWKKEYYQEVIAKLREKYKVLLIGSKNQEKALTELSNMDTNVSVLAGDLKLNEIPILLKRAKLFIGQDSGITHVALKIGVPLIAIIGGGEFGRFFPFFESENVKYLYSQMDCFLCHWECKKEEMFCMTDITPKVLLDEVEKVIRVGNDN
jgi:heptosyltransferase-1